MVYTTQTDKDGLNYKDLKEKEMRVLFWYCDAFGWRPAMKTLAHMPDADPCTMENVVVAFVHVEPGDIKEKSSAETKLVKNAKWLARKWAVTDILLHSFTHLAEAKADPDEAKALLDRVRDRLVKAGYQTALSAYGYFNDLKMEAPGHPLARIYKEF